ncbi:MAG: putative lipoprotein [Holophagaceae bacterium]|nr:putative lipoprotein [Holophagaceae bacterium]
MRGSLGLVLFCGSLLLLSCGGGSGGSSTGSNTYPPTDPTTGPAAGNPSGVFPVPAEARLEDVSSPDHVIGTGTPESCTAEAFINAVAQGGTITFNGGSAPFTITLPRPAKVYNRVAGVDVPKVVIDGGGVVTLSGGGTNRILYMNTCDESLVWTTNHCDNQALPHLTVQNLTFIDGNSKGDTVYDGGGAIWVRGGRFKAVNCRFFNNVCASTGPDVGGGAIRVTSQYNGLPVYIVHSTFGGADGYGNSGSNGGAISSIGVSWSIYNSLFSYNSAIGNGGNPAAVGTPGGGSGGAIYNDGNTMSLKVYGSLIERNTVNAFGSAIFFVTNDLTGNIYLEDTTIQKNTGGSWYPVVPGISMHATTSFQQVNCTITN